MYPDSTQAIFAYDTVGNRTVVTDGSGATTYTYDALNRKSSVALPESRTITYTYDAVGNRATMWETSALFTTYTYTARNELATLTNRYGETTTYVYDVVGRNLRRTMANGVTASHTYDAAGGLMGLTNAKSDGTVLSRFAYTYDDAGNKVGVTEADGAIVTYTYDSADRLTGDWRSVTNVYRVTYTYDNAGNRATMVTSSGTTAYTYDSANELTVSVSPSSTRTTYTYDNNGNRTAMNVGGTVTSYAWDYENRMTRDTLPSGTVNTFVYDVDGLRRGSTVSSTVRRFVWDGENVLLETNAAGTGVYAIYTQTPEQYGSVVSERTSSTSVYYSYDGQGSTSELTNYVGTQTDSYRYYGFGETRASSGSTYNRHRYVGKLGYSTETALGLQYLRARWYDPSAGAFLSVDPMRDGDNWYCYCGDDPTGQVDPSGLKKKKGCDCSLDYRADVPSKYLDFTWRLLQWDSFGRFLPGVGEGPTKGTLTLHIGKDAKPYSAFSGEHKRWWTDDEPGKKDGLGGNGTIPIEDDLLLSRTFEGTYHLAKWKWHEKMNQYTYRLNAQFTPSFLGVAYRHSYTFHIHHGSKSEGCIVLTSGDKQDLHDQISKKCEKSTGAGLVLTVYYTGV